MVQRYKVSIIIPAYNAEGTLRRCLDSVFAQTFESFEVILVNDGSLDRTSDIAKEYLKRPNFRLLTQQNEGVSMARWAGVRASKGGYICFVDADDYISNEMVSKMYESANNYNADIVICNWIRVLGNTQSEYLPYTNFCSNKSEENICRIILSQDNTALWNKMFNKEIIIEEDFKKTFRIRYGEDLLFCFLALLKANRIVYVSDPLYYNICTPGSVTQNPSLESIQDSLKVFDFLYNYVSSSNYSKLQKIIPLYYVPKLLNRYNQLCMLQDQNIMCDTLKKQIMKKCEKFPLINFINDGSDLTFLLKIILIKLHLFSLINDIWIKPFFDPIRQLRKCRKVHRF